MHLHPFCIGQDISDLKERDIRVLPVQPLKEGPVGGQLARVTRAALGRRSCMTPGLYLPRPASPGCRR